MSLVVMLGASALGAPVDRTRAQAMVDRLVPVVEERTGRRFVRVPEVRISLRDALRVRLMRPSGLSLALEEPSVGVSRELRQLLEPLVADALAVYVPYDERIYLVQEAFDALGQSFDLPMDVLEPLLLCVLTHELTHALQQQYGVEVAVGTSGQRGQKAVREGHASLVAYDHCASAHGQGIVRLMETVQGIDLEASLSPDDHAAVYGWGLKLAETLDAEGLLWSAMNAPPPEWTDIVAAVEPTLPPDWRAPDPLWSAVTRLGDDLRITKVRPVSPTSILTPFFANRWGVEALPRARGGFALEAIAGTDDVMILAFLFDKRGTATELLSGRRRSIEGVGLAWQGYGAELGAVVRGPKARTVGRALRHPRVLDALWFSAKTEGDGPYTEAWLATERRLFAVMASGRRLSQSTLGDVLIPMIGTMSPQPGAELGLRSLQAWIDRVRQVDEAATLQPSWQYRLHQAAERIERGDQAACAAVFRGPLIERSVVDLTGHARAAFDCAAVTLDLDLAQTALGLLDEVAAASAVRLASFALKEQRPRLALRLLDPAPVDPAMELEQASVELAALVGLRRWRAVDDILRRYPMLPGSVRAYAGRAMIEAGQRDGLEIVVAACPELVGDEREWCNRLIEPPDTR